MNENYRLCEECNSLIDVDGCAFEEHGDYCSYPCSSCNGCNDAYGDCFDCY